MGDHALLTAREIHGPFMQLLTNLQGSDGPEWLDALKRFNRRENPWPVLEAKDTPVFCEVTLGLCTPQDYESDLLIARAIRATFDGAREYLKRATPLTIPTVVKVAVVSLRQLGFSHEVPGEVAWKRASELGFKLCPIETAPALLLQHRELVVGKRIYFSRNLMMQMHERSIFVIRPHDMHPSDGRPTLERTFMHTYQSYVPRDLFAFIKP
jgi:hypothetical protein